MLKAPVPDNEDTRLQTLRGLDLLDTLPEERFDRVTRLARRLFGVPIALVSLVDAERQWFKSRQGLDATETPREVSFCGHAILAGDALVVPDASEDPRFLDNPLVTAAPRIRFYAGQPVSAPNGCRLGTLCLIDQVPRDLSEEDLKLLRDLAALIEDEIAAFQTATLDSLTGLSNRAGFGLLAEKSFNLCRRMEKPASVLFFDMDGFKEINDTVGHGEGDQALKDFANLLLQTFRTTDTVARLGGDEFAVFLSGAGAQETEGVLARLDENVRRHNAGAGRDYELRFSVGAVAFDPQRHAALDDLLREADKRMYEKKRTGHGAPADAHSSRDAIA